MKRNKWFIIFTFLISFLILTSLYMNAEEEKTYENYRINVETGEYVLLSNLEEIPWIFSTNHKYMLHNTEGYFEVIDGKGNRIQLVNKDLSFEEFINEGIISYTETRPKYKQFYSLNLRTKEKMPLWKEIPNFPYVFYNFSPNGQSVAYKIFDQEMNTHLHIVDMERDQDQLIGTIGVTDPIWSPDGTMLAYVDMGNSFSATTIIQSDGTRIHQFSSQTDPLDWSNNGKYLLLGNRGSHTLEVIDTATWETVHSLNVYEVNEAQWSPDDSQFFYTAHKRINDHTTSLWVSTVSGEKKCLVDMGHSYLFLAIWSLDGKDIYFVRSILSTNKVSFWESSEFYVILPLSCISLWLLIRNWYRRKVQVPDNEKTEVISL